MEVKMNLKQITIGLIFCVLISGCSLSVNYIPKTSYANTPKPSTHLITVFQMNENLPSEYIAIGSVSVGEGGMTMKCGYDDVIIAAQKKARNVGGDAIQIVQLKEPDLFSSCYNLIANVLVVNADN